MTENEMIGSLQKAERLIKDRISDKRPQVELLDALDIIQGIRREIEIQQGERLNENVSQMR